MGYFGGVLWWGIVVGYWHRGIVTGVLRWDIVVGYCGGVLA